MKTSKHNAELREAVDYNVQQLRSGDFESAFHGLIDLDPEIVHPLIAAYRSEPSSDLRSDLLRIIWEFRTRLALPLLAEMLRGKRGQATTLTACQKMSPDPYFPCALIRHLYVSIARKPVYSNGDPLKLKGAIVLR